ncbi:MAG: Crp/Fnr family transcriptional regulator [Gammaproteobacteria bacterium]|nr:Crp/Fnr family transcriptional regulator [Gammaproteobacteria bacterium]
MEILDANEVIGSLGLPYLRDLSTFGALSDEVIEYLLNRGSIKRFEKGDYLARYDEIAEEFQIVLSGKIAFYKHCEGHDVLTRYFRPGEQMSFDLMIGLIRHDGIDVAVEDSQILDISSSQFFDLRVNYPADFGLLMINLARELSREIAMLEDVIGDSIGWHLEE